MKPQAKNILLVYIYKIVFHKPWDGGVRAVLRASICLPFLHVYWVLNCLKRCETNSADITASLSERLRSIARKVYHSHQLRINFFF